jgi:SusD family.
MKLNRISKILTVSAVLVGMNACDITDIDPANRIPESVAFSDAARVVATVNGVYEAAQQGFYAGAVQRGYPFGAASTEQGDMKGEDMYNDQLFYEVTYTNAWNPTTANNNGMWISLYRLINRANIVIDGIASAEQSGAITADEAKRYRGEMLFIRALSHHELLIHYSRPYSDDPSKPGVPYRTVAIDDAGKVAAGIEASDRGTVQQAYAKILTDLDEAEQLLGNEGRPYRATKGAAIALKTRVKLHMKDWAGVITEATKMKTMGGYALTEAPDGPFQTWTSSESVFSLQNSSASNPGVNGALVNMYGDPELGGRGLVKISPVIWKSSFWLEGDLRRTEMTSESSTGIFTTKYYRFGTNDDPTPLIRYAEVVLNAAEAHARLNEDDDALDLLNSVRDRALADPADSYTPATVGDLLEAILNERRIEFLAEGRRWPDIHRLSGEGLLDGIPLKAQTRSVTSINQYSSASVNMDHALPYSSNLFVWPIPLEETLYNPILEAQQNPGY